MDGNITSKSINKSYLMRAIYVNILTQWDERGRQGGNFNLCTIVHRSWWDTDPKALRMSNHKICTSLLCCFASSRTNSRQKHVQGNPTLGGNPSGKVIKLPPPTPRRPDVLPRLLQRSYTRGLQGNGPLILGEFLIALLVNEDNITAIRRGRHFIIHKTSIIDFN